jgi:hypothetical protein
MERKSNNYKILYHKFFVFLPALLIILLIAMIYISYWVSYIIPLIQNWNTNIANNPLQYPFLLTSTNKNSITKGLILGILSLFFVTLLLINLIRTIFSDPGYFPNALELEYQIVIKNLIHQEQENNNNNKEKEINKSYNENDNDNYYDNENEIKKKKNHFKIEKFPLDKLKNNNNNYKENSNSNLNLKNRKNSLEKINSEEEKSYEIFKEKEKEKVDNLNLINFTQKISESPICYEEFNKQADILKDWSYKIDVNKYTNSNSNNNNNNNDNDNQIILNGNKKIKINKKNDKKKSNNNNNNTELNLINNNNNNNINKTLLINEENKNSTIQKENSNELKLNTFDAFIGYDVGKAFLCGNCVRLKVERSHHCKQCGKCVLKMDHHCPWLANCIGYNNYKFFLLTHLYGSISCFIVLASYWETFINSFFDLNQSIFILSWHLFIYVCTIGLFSFLVWLLGVNWILMFQNLTVIENADRERFPSAKFKNIYDLGYYRNFKNVFGDNFFIWFLPILPYDKYKGIYFEKNDDANNQKLMMLL